MAVGYFSLVLHAHLPFVRHPEDATVMEEQWLYEVITGTYLPLLQVFDGLVRDHIPFRCTVSLSAPLMTMLTDDLLKVRYAQHLDKLIELTEKEIDRTKPEPHYNRLAHMYHDRFCSLREVWRGHEGDLVRAFKWLQAAGRVEVITSTATHAFFPLMDRNWANIRAEARGGRLYERNFGHRRAAWLRVRLRPGRREPCARRPSATFRRLAGILFADGRPAYGVFAPDLPRPAWRLRGDMESSSRWSAGGPPGSTTGLLYDIGFRPADGLHRHIPGRAPHLHRHQVPTPSPSMTSSTTGCRPTGGPRGLHARFAATARSRCEPARTWIARR
jgi:1,4-alpha-glucan branching enzyme